ncbi:short-chain fatty acyl-CoA regulator family protein [Streptomyces sp. DT24]|uniref:short-chain fatty acyl-CoA regulator family protein n=1 Tax=unclassified Streptomyces TaxID=2593676 RepID=UPI0023B92CD3|nr:short-chain fatty acyl-CoA regulator family protein [Streptomyces sp. AM 4-1-1]WEH37365.1 short-chain fatty acyl-CoA regulator family protein [Streptomyces sp. AM 4-1-1]
MARAAGRKIYAHAKLRRLRSERGMNQVELARSLGISTSYLNQIEHSQRPLTAPVLLRIAEVLGVEAEFFSEAAEERLATDLRTALGDEASGVSVPVEQAAEVVRDHPEVARALVALHHRYRDAAEQVAALASADAPASSVRVLPPAEPHDEVRDFFYAHHNHFGRLDSEAERAAHAWGLDSARTAAEILRRRLADRHRVTVVEAAPERSADARRFDAARGLLFLSPWLTDGQQSFQLATQIALLEYRPLLDALIETAALTSAQSADLGRIGLANYFAGALLMPYTAFRTAAEELRYDIELLQARFGVGFETVCHRLSTLQRSGQRGVPFSFLRVDRAGNVSKRQSATDFHFSRLGGTCPLWTVYAAFSSPGRVLTQVAEMPDGKRHFWVARTVTRGGAGHRASRAEFAVALGCELRHAHRLVYAEGIALDDPRAATPIGLGCRICERRDCAQRARPPAGGRLAVDPDRRTYVPYPVETSGGGA